MAKEKQKHKRVKIVEDTRTLLQILPGKPPVGMRPYSKSGSSGTGREVSTSRALGPEGLVRILHAQDRQRTYKEKHTGTRCIKQRTPISYEMYFEPNQYRFYLSVPTSSYRSISEHVKKAWVGSSVKVEEDDYIEIFEEYPSSYCEIKFGKYYFFPMNFASGEPLNSLINVAKGLKAGERMMFQTMMIPLKTSWQTKARELYQTYRETGDPSPGIGWEEMLKSAEKEITEVFDILTGSLLGLSEPESKKRSLPPEFHDKDAKFIQEKLSESAFKCMMRVFVSASTQGRRTEILNEVAHALRCVEGKNLLEMSSVRYQVPIDMARRYTGITQELGFNRNILSISEISGLLQAPDAYTLDRHPEIQKAGQQAIVPPPPFMLNGYVPVGVLDAQSDPHVLYWDHRDVERFMVAKIIAGAPGSGKTTYLQTFIHSLKRIHHGVFVFDIIEKCGLVKEIAESLNPGDYEIWDLEKAWTEMSFDYSELYRNFDEDNYVARKIRANLIASQIIKLLNALNGGELTDRMEQVIRSAAKIVFAYKDKTLNDFIHLIRFSDVRQREVEKAKAMPKNSKGMDLFTREDLADLDLIEKMDDEGNKIGETDMNVVDPILTRLSVLSEDPRTYQMLKNPVSPKYDMEEAVLKNKIILIRVPQTASEEGELGFSEETRAMITAFFSFKLWLVKQGMMAGKDENKKVINKLGEEVKLKDLYVTHMIYDEVHQIPETLNVLGKHMKEFRKFRLAPVFTCHGLTNFDKKVVSEIGKLGAAYLLLDPTEHETVETLVKTTIRGLEIDDIMDMPRYHLTAHIPAGERYLDVILKSPGTIEGFQELEKSINSKKRSIRKKRKRLTASQRFFAQLEGMGVRLEKAENAPIDKIINFVAKTFAKESPQSGDNEGLNKEDVTALLTEEPEVLTEEKAMELVSCEFDEVGNNEVGVDEHPLVKCEKQSNQSFVKWLNRNKKAVKKEEVLKTEDAPLISGVENKTELPNLIPLTKNVADDSLAKIKEENPFVKRAREQAERYRKQASQSLSSVEAEKTNMCEEVKVKRPVTVGGKINFQAAVEEVEAMEAEGY